MNSKIGMFSVLVLGVIMLLIPASSLANAQEYDKYYDDEQYKKDNKSDEPVIIIKNEPIQKKEKKKMKEPPMLLVKKDVLYCDLVASGTGEPIGCFPPPYPEPNSERYVQDCTADNFLCNDINEELFKIIVTDDVKFPGSEDGIKLNFTGERYTVTEDVIMGEILQNEIATSDCQEAGFDNGFILANIDGQISNEAIICIVSEDECSGIVSDNELKECTIKNYVIHVAT